MDPRSIDAVLIYAQRGHGRRANLYTDFTFAVWRGEELVPFAKAYSGLTDEEMKQVDAFVKKQSLESFGPVRKVEPLLVFEIGFEGIQPSSRHKSGSFGAVSPHVALAARQKSGGCELPGRFDGIFGQIAL